MDAVGRKSLPHDPPLRIGTGGVLFFVTICARDRVDGALIQGDVPKILIDSVRFRHERGMWFVRLFLVMPDHVHMLLRLPVEGTLKNEIRSWKRRTAREGGFVWQRDFFDHRLRAEESEREKADYILENPVRAGLVGAGEDWPWRWVG